MKLSAWHKQQGDSVEWHFPLETYDRVYVSKVFTFSPEIDVLNAPEVVRGGTGYDLNNKLPEEVEAMQPDYSIYPQYKEAYGFMTRGCPNNCPFCIVSQKEGRCSRQVADLSDFLAGRKTVKLLDPNLLACQDRERLLTQLADSKARIDFTQGLDARLVDKDVISLLNCVKIDKIHFAWDLMKNSDAIVKGLNLYLAYGNIKDCRKLIVYVLTNYDTTQEEDLYRVYRLRGMGYNPFVMVYDKVSAPLSARKLQRWVNNKRIWRSCERFEDYNENQPAADEAAD